jgi:general L-amino acid transport system permease protein
MAVEDQAARLPEQRTSLIYDPKFRGFVFQAALAIALVAFIAWIVSNTIQNLQRAHIASGFAFLSQRAGFDVSLSLIPFNAEMSYGRAFLVGLLNTLLVAVLGIVFASILGFTLGVARLSKNWLIARLATVYIETLRNIPVLLQLLFWYRAVLSILPGPRQGISLPFDAFLSNRGLAMPKPVFGEGFSATVIAAVVAIVAVVIIARWAYRRQMATGQRFPTLWTSLAILLGLPLVVFFATGRPATLDYPTLQGFNYAGGAQVPPQFIALLLGLSLYTATYIGEIVRAGILAVAHGQTEASYALGLRPGTTLRLVVIPQALRVIIPPLTSQYLNLTKNSSLAVAIGYPDLVSVFAGTVLNQTGQAVEVLFITMLVYLAISLSTSALMNWFNRRVALVER